MVDKVALGQVFLLVLRFSTVSIIAPEIRTHLFLYHRRYMIMTMTFSSSSRFGAWSLHALHTDKTSSCLPTDRFHLAIHFRLTIRRPSTDSVFKQTADE
jgi:hypothetical protein